MWTETIHQESFDVCAKLRELAGHAGHATPSWSPLPFKCLCARALTSTISLHRRKHTASPRPNKINVRVFCVLVGPLRFYKHVCLYFCVILMERFTCTEFDTLICCCYYPACYCVSLALPLKSVYSYAGGITQRYAKALLRQRVTELADMNDIKNSGSSVMTICANQTSSLLNGLQ